MLSIYIFKYTRLFCRAEELMTRKTASVIVLVICLIFHVHVFVTYELATPENSTNRFCAVANNKYRAIAPWTQIILFSLLPCLIISICNIMIVYFLIKNAKLNITNTQEDTVLQKSIYKIVPMVLMVITVFVTCTLPASIYFICKFFQ